MIPTTLGAASAAALLSTKARRVRLASTSTALSAYSWNVLRYGVRSTEACDEGRGGDGREIGSTVYEIYSGLLHSIL